MSKTLLEQMYDKVPCETKIEVCVAETRAATIAEVLAVVDDRIAVYDSQESPESDTALDVCYDIRKRLAALSPAPNEP